ncbi:NAD(P)H oxidoreductase [Leucobacter denitrificans]|uniref:NAD(P)H oxidoreductase n=1 Tax=Leucobacter denitrificans TaxID=683042 RepID=A0A7G9S7W4_9MICO|nr:NAD(P)H oxidoreductase [Leucobacter denitrificans]
MKTIVVWAHPREDSLTGKVASDAIDELQSLGHDLTVVDLYRSAFEPILREPDEPDWENLDKEYSPDVMEHIKEYGQADSVVFVFPVWWYSFPALMKGYVDRVWNHGYFYGGGRRIGFERVLWVALAGDTQEAFAKRNYDEMMERYLNVGIAQYCGAKHSEVEFLYNTLAEGVADMSFHVSSLRSQARRAVQRVVAFADVTSV